MRPSAKPFTIVLLFMLVAYTAAGIDLNSLGYSIVSEHRERERIVYELRDAEGHSFALTATGEITVDDGELIRRSIAAFFGWTSMTVSYLRITLIGGTATVLVVPSSYVYQDRDLVPFLPSGMQFYVSRVIEYDFRIKVDNIFVRLRGNLNEEASFTERLAAAIEDPAGFIERNDPDYVLRELRDVHDAITDLGLFDAELQDKLEALKENVSKADDAIRADLERNVSTVVSSIESLADEFRDTYAEAVTAFSDLKADYVETKNAGIEVARKYFETVEDYLNTKEELRALEIEHAELAREYGAFVEKSTAFVEKFVEDYKAFLEEYDSLAEDYRAFKETNAALFAEQASVNEELQRQITNLRYAFIAKANESFFGKLRPVDGAAAVRILELKEENPELTDKQIASALAEEGFRVGAKGVRFVLLAYRGIVEEN